MSQQVSVSNPATRATALVSSEQVQVEVIKSRRVLHLLLIAMRPHQWVKNLFILTPLLFGKKLLDPLAVGYALLACASFCLMCSALYIINDIIDAPEDRAHPEKRLRPIASGALTIPVALGASLTLLAGGFWIASTLGVGFLLLALTYFGLTLGYCVSLKQAMILDCMIIATGFVLRVVSGTVAVEIEPTHWLIACAFLLALYLAFAKRRQELLMLSDEAVKHRQVLGKYTISYLEQVNNILIGATIVCYALYTVAPETVARFNTDKLIYGSVFVIYGLLRYMALIRDPRTGGNPSKMLIRDKPLLLTVFGWAGYNGLIIYRDALMDLWGRLQ
jgi:4-hydroxybenzoate polyprenyltransferase